MEGFATAAVSTETQDSTPRKSIQKLSESFCAPQYAASLKYKFAHFDLLDLRSDYYVAADRIVKATCSGLDDSDYDKSKCQDRFEAYKACRKQEREIRLEANRKSKRFF